MLVLGHVGVTLGVFLLIGLFVPGIRSHIRYRYLALGALLPDIIDKPLGHLILADTLANGRIIGHTLFFSLVIIIAGLYIFRKKSDSKILMLGAGSFFHLLEDRMWVQPVTFFWPIFGLQFPRGAVERSGLNYFLTVFNNIFDPDFSYAFISDIIGLIVLIVLAILYLKKK